MKRVRANDHKPKNRAEASAPTRWNRTVDGSSLALFRVFFGLAIAWQAGKYLARGWVTTHYVEPELHFKFFGFGWVHEWPGAGAHAHFVALIALAICVGLGLFYRLCTILLFLGLTHWLLIDTTYYNNHYYLECLIAFLLIFLPTANTGSLDARRAGRSPAGVPAWSLWLLRAEIGIVYFYGGLAKLDPDWLTGVPIRAILGDHARDTWVGSFVRSSEGGLFLAWSGLALDLLVVPLLLWRRTRWIAFVLALIFHVSNAYLFRIGVFPWFMAAATTLFFEPDWPRRLWARLRKKGALPENGGATTTSPAPSRSTAAVLGAFLAFQLLFPLRHWLYPGRVTWSEQGLRFAWHMMLRHKVARSQFLVETPEGETLGLDIDWPINAMQYEYMQYEPAAVVQLAHYLAAEAERQGHPDARVRALVECSLNGREPQFLIDPEVDLAREELTWRPFDWVVPLATALPPERPYGGRLDDSD